MPDAPQVTGLYLPRLREDAVDLEKPVEDAHRGQGGKRSLSWKTPSMAVRLILADVLAELPVQLSYGLACDCPAIPICNRIATSTS